MKLSRNKGWWSYTNDQTTQGFCCSHAKRLDVDKEFVQTLYTTSKFNSLNKFVYVNEGKDCSISPWFHWLLMVNSDGRLSAKWQTINGTYYAYYPKRGRKFSKCVLFHQENAHVHKFVTAITIICVNWLSRTNALLARTRYIRFSTISKNNKRPFWPEYDVMQTVWLSER